MLVLEKLTKTFPVGGGSVKVAVDRVDLLIEKGQFVTVIGSNGAGKSTLMNIISGVLLPDIGEVYIAGQPVHHLPEYRRSRWIGRVFQDPMAGTAPNMTIEENLAIAYARGKRRGLTFGVTRARRNFFREQLERLNLGLENRLKAKVGQLSGGERQALSLLMATFTKPQILLLDEHTAALDPSHAELVIRLTENIVRELKLTTLMVTHNMEQALRLGNRLIMMDKGRIILDVDPERKKELTVERLLQEFERISGHKMADDRVMLG